MSTIYDIQHNEYRAAIRGTGRAHGECYQIPTQVRSMRISHSRQQLQCIVTQKHQSTFFTSINIKHQHIKLCLQITNVLAVFQALYVFCSICTIRFSP